MSMEKHFLSRQEVQNFLVNGSILQSFSKAHTTSLVFRAFLRKKALQDSHVIAPKLKPLALSPHTWKKNVKHTCTYFQSETKSVNMHKLILIKFTSLLLFVILFYYFLDVIIYFVLLWNNTVMILTPIMLWSTKAIVCDILVGYRVKSTRHR